MKRRLGSDELGLRSSSWTETLDGKRSQMTGKELQQWAILKKEERRDLGLVDGLRFETEEDSAEYLRKREEAAAAARPDRRGQALKPREERKGGKRFASKDPKGEAYWDEFIPALTPEKAGRLHDQWYEAYKGTKWPAWACRVMKRIHSRSLVVEAA